MTKTKLIKRLLKRIIPLAIIAFIYWPITALFLVTGFYDVLRQKNRNIGHVMYKYFLVNGTLTWLFSPINTLIDIICLPFINKQTYKLDQLPKKHQAEINDILKSTPKEFVVNAVTDLKMSTERSMLLYKWYGYNVENNYPCPLLHKKFKRVLTIGVSTFNSQTETSEHFGWSRAGVRVLINVDAQVADGAYIDVNNQRHVWNKDGPLFIFDDTVMHQSFNLTDARRHCLFIDVTRPSMFPWLINSFVKFMGFLSMRISWFSKSSNWKLEK